MSDVDPIEEMMTVLEQTLAANALRIVTTRGGYVGGGQPHAELSSDTGAVDAIARGLLARKVAEPSRTLAAIRSESAGTLDVERLARAMHLARLLPDMNEPYCDNPLTDADLANHVRWAEAILHAAQMLPPYSYVGGEQPHPMLDSNPGATDAIARGREDA